MSEKLLIYDELQLPFDVIETEQAFGLVDGMSSIRRSPKVVSAVEADHKTSAGVCIVRLISSRKAIAIEGTLEAIAESVFTLKNVFEQSLRIIDQEYTFDLAISDLASSKHILEKLVAALHQ